MAKRAEIAGQGLIILDATGVADRYATNERVRDAGGRVLHRFGSRVLIGDVPARVTRKAASTPGLKSAHAGVVAKPPGRLTEVEALGVAAWNLRMSAAYAQAKEDRPHDGLRWDAAPPAGPIPPDGPGMTHVEDAPPGALGVTVPEDMSTYLIGSVAVGIVMVDGPTADLQFTPDERTKVVAEVQEGLTWMAHVDARAGVSYSYDIRSVQIDRAPDPTKSGYEPLESHWRDPAMIKLGFAGNMLGVYEYVKTIRRNLGTKWGYVGLFTKYPTEHFAYALKPKLVMQYSNDGWGPDNIDRVFTHESGHIFGCPDEYASSGCDCTTKFGYLREPNRNCQNCATPFVDCLMAGNTFAMCASTPIHLGWRDTDGDGALDPVDPVGNPSPVIDLGKICSFVPFLCQLVGLGQTAPPAGAAGVAGAVGPLGAPAPESIPVELLRQVLTDDEMARVDRAIRNEELRYLEALERKLRAAVRDIARERKRG
jgi:hypothetical protein